jgi:sortase A
MVVALLLALGGWQLGQGVWIHAKALLAQQLLQQAWAESLSGEQRARPWPWADTWPVARLRVNRLGVDQILLAGASGRSLAFGPGHVSGTAEPGSMGNSVLSGHRDTHFRFLKELQDGDQLEIQLPDGRFARYAVTRAQVHHQDEVWLLAPTPVSRLTLVTCYPFDAPIPGGPLRYVVTAKAVQI